MVVMRTRERKQSEKVVNFGNREEKVKNKSKSREKILRGGGLTHVEVKADDESLSHMMHSD